MTYDEQPKDPFFERLVPIFDAFTELLEAGEALRRRWHSMAAAESVGMVEFAAENRYAGAANKEPVRNVHLLGGMMLGLCEEHGRSLMRLFAPGERVPVLSDIVLGRAALEAAGRARWLLEPGIGVERRIMRGVSETLDDLKARRRFPEEVSSGQRSEDEAIRDLLEYARQHGFIDPEHAGRTRERRPGYIEIITLLFADPRDVTMGEVLARWWAAAAHSSVHAIRQQMDTENSTVDPFTGAVTVGLYTDTRKVAMVIAGVVMGYVTAVGAQTELFGWKDDHRWLAALVGAQGLLHEIFPVPDSSPEEPLVP